MVKCYCDHGISRTTGNRDHWLEGHLEKETQYLKRVIVKPLDSLLQDEYETKWEIRIFYPQKSSFHSSLSEFGKENEKIIADPQETDPRCGACLGVWKEMVNRQRLKTAEFTKSQNTGLADLIHDIEAFFGLMRKQMKIIPLQ